MKSFIIGLVLLILCTATVVGIRHHQKSSRLRLAATAYSQGDFRTAQNLWVEALEGQTHKHLFPDANRAKVPPPPQWQRIIETYLNRTSDSMVHRSPLPTELISHIHQCIAHSVRENFYTNDVTVPADSSSLAQAWRRAFFPASPGISADHGPLIREAQHRGVSILRIHSLRDYTYRGFLLDQKTLARTDFILYPESDITLLIRRDSENLLVLTSEVTFPDGKQWRSGWSAFFFSAPASPTLRSMVMKTRVGRGTD